jgi:hypothetical protein
MLKKDNNKLGSPSVKKDAAVINGIILKSSRG